ncbi:MAG: formylglycine-generating enzyme family protein [Treponema sp.]|nr:formylglycine-generating enzyme family protein [Treponema sp.]
MDIKKIRVLSICIIFTLFVQSVHSQVRNEMIMIQGGTFTMGSPEGEPGKHMDHEGPQHQVTLSSFYIAKFPVTQAEYLEIMGVNPSYYSGPDFPVEQVTWNNAVDYCNRRSIAEGLTPVYTIDGNNVTWNRNANGYRLPTESEWEYACRAGTQTPFNIGNSMDDAGWHRDNALHPVTRRSTFPVGQKRPNAWGLYDMHGNVLEWCWDWFAPYTPEPKVNPTGPATSYRTAPYTNRRVYRGGCWDFPSTQCRSAYRFGQHQNFRFFYNGFRVARNAQ